MAHLSELRSEGKFSEVWEVAAASAEVLGVELRKPRTAKFSFYRANAGGTGCSPEEYYRVNAWYLDGVLADLRVRFGPRQKQAAQLERLIPRLITSDTEAKDVFEAVKPAFKQFQSLFSLDVSERTLRSEVEVWTWQWQRAGRERPQSAAEALDVCSAASFLTVNGLLQVTATLPITTCSAERLLSKLKQTCTSLRSTMTEGRLEAELLVQCNRDSLPPHSDTLARMRDKKNRRLDY